MLTFHAAQSEGGEFDDALALFDKLIDDLRFGENAPADGGAAQRRDDEFIIGLDRECAAITLAPALRRRIQRTLPTYSGAIVDYNPMAPPLSANTAGTPVVRSPVTYPT